MSHVMKAEVAELVDAQDLKSCVQQWTYGFDSRLRHHIFLIVTQFLRYSVILQRKTNRHQHEF